MKLPRKQLAKLGIDPFIALCKAHGLPEPIPEYHFAKEVGRKWRFDYLFLDWLGVEKDGGLFGRGPKCPMCKRAGPGAHSSISQMQKDREKDRYAVLLGYSVLRFTPAELRSGEACAFIKQVLETQQ